MKTNEEMFQQATKLLQEDQLKEGIFLLQQLANQNYPPALFQLSVCYRYGVGVEVDENQAFDYLLRYSGNDIKVDYVEISKKISSFYEKGKDISTSNNKQLLYEAYQVLRWAAPLSIRKQCYRFLKEMTEHNDMDALYYIGALYLEERLMFVDVNQSSQKELGLTYLQKAKEQGHQKASLLLKEYQKDFKA